MHISVTVWFATASCDSREPELPSARTAALRATQQLHFTLPGIRRRLASLPGVRYSARLVPTGLLRRPRYIWRPPPPINEGANSENEGTNSENEGAEYDLELGPE